MSSPKMVAVVDDDESVRESLPDMLKSFGLKSRPFPSALDFLASNSIYHVDCLVLDVAMPGMTGPELQQELLRLGHRIPIIFITAHSDEKAWPMLHASGAVACLVKPFSEQAIKDAIKIALSNK